MKQRKKYITLLELFAFSLILTLINLLFPRDPGFFTAPFNPYILLAYVVSAYYGKYHGYANLLFSALFLVSSLPFLLLAVKSVGSLDHYWQTLVRKAAVPAPTALIGTYVFGLIHDFFKREISKERKRLKSTSQEKHRLKKERDALSTVNRELEERVLRQHESITTLYSRIQGLYSLNLDQALDAILETIQTFAWVKKASIWEYTAEKQQLKLVKQTGWKSFHNKPLVLDLNTTIEGWVFRNDKVFSVRQLYQYEHLMELNVSQNIMTFPITTGRRTWGVLNIEDMPFSKYNIYTEKILSILIDLAGMALERRIEYESLISRAEINPHTKLPSFSIFYQVLEKELDLARMQQAHASLIILEIINFEETLQILGKEGCFTLVVQITDRLKTISGSGASFYHYKQERQLAVIYPHLDQDGASLFCLETLEILNNYRWIVGEKEIFLEVVLGFASLAENIKSAADLIKIAENLMEMQKI